MDVEIKIGRKLEAIVPRVLNNASLWKQIMDQWSRVYAAFIQRRFNAASRGDGTWKPLAASTVAARQRRRKGKGKVIAILVDTGLLRRNLQPGIEEKKSVVKQPFGFEMYAYFGSDEEYPQVVEYYEQVGETKSGKKRYKKKTMRVPTGVTVRDVMGFHQRGGGNLPRREILVSPDAKTKEQMGKIALRMIRAELRSA